MFAAVSEVLSDNNQLLSEVVQSIKNGEMTNDKLILSLSMLLASNKTLEVITRPAQPIQGVARRRPEANRAPVPAFVAEVENDNPETEDRDLKKIREEDRGFYD